MDLRRRNRVPLVLEIDLARGLLTQAPQDPLEMLRARATPTLTDVLAGLRRGAEDDDVVAAVVHVGGTVTAAVADELGQALTEFSARGKATVAFSESFGELGPGTVPYYLAAHADTIWLQPTGQVGLTGVSLELSTVRGALDKIGVEPQIGQRQEYKTAAERLTATEVSDANREMSQRLADSVLEQVTAQVCRTRGLTPTEVDALVAEAPIEAGRAHAAHLVDHLGYRDAVYAAVRREHGRDGEVRLQYAHRYAHSAKAAASGVVDKVRRRSRPVVAVVEVHGGIVTGRGGSSPLGGRSVGSDQVLAALRLAREDDDVKAVVLRVDSPGGSYVASDAIRDGIRVLRETGRPVVASMGAVAGSGGYFVSMPADEIVALPTTLTGSIGVLGGKLVTTEVADKVGLAREAVGAGAHATMFTSLRRFDDDEQARVDGWLDAVYADFTTKAAADRGMALDDLEPLARGRVWTGADARERGLVDTSGGLATAVERACARIDRTRDDVQVRRVPHLGLLDRLGRPDSSEDALDAVGSGSGGGLVAGLARQLGLPADGVLTMTGVTRIT
ncbi:signal peptide peptidase SppA [Solicola sp. PLA-1-18]|uniref:signal peptide peptidase SppA n=1 Tax=Solicola sp. PLA-1-18 TaxID=3380532 RepID=UPI003B7D7FFE